MATFTIWKVEKKKQFTTQHGTFQAYELTLEAKDKSHVVAELVQKPETAEPVAGTEITGTLEEGNYGKKFKKERQQSSSNGEGKSDPTREARISHMHAQKCALSYAHLRQAQGKLPPNFELDDLFKIAALFRANVESVTAA